MIAQAGRQRPGPGRRVGAREADGQTGRRPRLKGGGATRVQGRRPEHQLDIPVERDRATAGDNPQAVGGGEGGTGLAVGRLEGHAGFADGACQGHGEQRDGAGQRRRDQPMTKPGPMHHRILIPSRPHDSHRSRWAVSRWQFDGSLEARCGASTLSVRPPRGRTTEPRSHPAWQPPRASLRGADRRTSARRRREPSCSTA